MPSLNTRIWKWLHFGHGTKYSRWSLVFHAAWILLSPSTVGVEHMITFLLCSNSPVRCIASDTGSPSDPALVGYLSISSSNRYRIGRMARPDGEMAPVNVMCPDPLANTLCIAVLFESRDFTAASFPLSAGECRNNGATRSFESALASSDRGSTASVGPGSTSAM